MPDPEITSETKEAIAKEGDRIEVIPAWLFWGLGLDLFERGK